MQENKLKITIIIPCYNEVDTILKIVDKIKKKKLLKQIILVDDFSTDGSRELIKKINQQSRQSYFSQKNFGKGQCIISAKKFVKGILF